jgi:hypothetical protein
MFKVHSLSEVLFSFSRGSRVCSVKCSLVIALEIVPNGLFVCGKEFGEPAFEVCVCVSLCRKRRRKMNTNVDCACVRLCELGGGGGGGVGVSGMCTALLLTYTTHSTELPLRSRIVMFYNSASMSCFASRT